MRREFFDEVYNEIGKSKNAGMTHLTTDLGSFTGSPIEIDGKFYVNYTLCDYLKLSQDQRIKEGAIKAVEKYGVYTAVSRTYVKLHLYDEAEEYVSQIFNKPVILIPRTTLAHIAVLPVIIDDKDAVILDHQAHTSVKLGSDILKASGNTIELLRHNNLNRLEERIIELRKTHKKIWYLTDGVYSMYGDTLPFDGIKSLLDKYEELNVYVDDAHGMSWRGEHGKGYLLDKIPDHPRIFLVTSLGKGFGAGGSAIVCQNEHQKDRIATCGAPLIFSSPVGPATLGAIVEAAKIHLSPEIYEYQKLLDEKVQLFNDLCDEYSLPLVEKSDTPIFYMATSLSEFTTDVAISMLNHGAYVTGGAYPAVPLRNSGTRVIVSNYQSLDEIKDFLSNFKIEYEKGLEKYQLTPEKIMRFFKK
ncbi:aminotransferase class I/II-fold pyridoxal phosphate-dependent enzyme [Saccharicrinis sp. FJH62]|uniref:aminotransferase class I/II-fold pyridoxal phosphate-dependent enzyme n=1 Tax=Saccharicrinis sp. FJH62 TaxID=3344657 RepID=UPI0035D4B918